MRLLNKFLGICMCAWAAFQVERFEHSRRPRVVGREARSNYPSELQARAAKRDGLHYGQTMRSCLERINGIFCRFNYFFSFFSSFLNFM